MASNGEIELLWVDLLKHRPVISDRAFDNYYPSRHWMSTVLGRQVWHEEWIEVRNKLLNGIEALRRLEASVANHTP